VPKLVYDFTEGNKDLRDLLGGKGANLAEMTNLGLPVPPGFIITTEACRYYLEQGSTPAGLDEEIAAHLERLEAAMGRKLGDPADPLLVSVRSGAKFSMPGMMETVLNIGLSDESVQGLAKQAGNERFAWDSYRRLLQMFGKTVLDIDGEHFEHAIDEAKRAKGVRNDLDLDAGDLQSLVDTFKGIIKAQTGRDFPQDPREQMDLAIKAVFNSWNAPRAILYRRQERIPADLGTAVNVVTMVFGNLGMDSGTGVAFTRDPGTGAQGVYGDYLQNAQGEDVVAGIRNTVPLQDLESIDKASYDQLMQIMRTLENHYRDLCDIEFTIERGKLWMLQTRVGKRTAAAAFRIAIQLVDQGLIDMDEAVRRVSGEELARLMFPRFDTSADVTKIATGISASPGAAVGKAVFDSARAVELAAQGEKVILVRRETNPDDLHGMIAAQGILTSRGGKTSHAAVVARGMGKTCVCGADELDVDTKARKFTASGGVTISEGDMISIDGTSGAVYSGEVPVVSSAVVRYFEGELHPHSDEADDLIRAVHAIMRRRPGPHRAHVPRRAPPAGRGSYPGRHRGGAAARARCPRAAAARRLRRDPRRHGRPAGDDPADRPAAARVPARPDRTLRQDRPGGRRRDGKGQAAARRGAPAARAEPDARPARRPPRPGHPGPVRHAGARDRPRGGAAQAGGQGPAAGSHDPAHRDRAGDGDQP
jgi:pyruvate, orthophosphate dikinase